LSVDQAHTLARQLSSFDHELSVGAPPEVTAADDLGVRADEWLDADGLSARMILATGSGQQTLDLARSSRADPAIEALEGELARALHAVHPRLQLQSDRGPDTVTPVVHRTSGRLGVELWFGPPVWEGLDGDAVAGLRRDALAGLAAVVMARAEHPELRLAPDPLWAERLGGMALVAWIVAPHTASLPGDEALPAGLWPPPTALGALLRGHEGLAHDLEVQLVTDDHEAAVQQVVGGAGGEAWLGGPPRWVRHDGRWRFVPTWRAPMSADTATVAQRLAEALPAVRLVPGALAGLDDDDPWLLRYHRWGRHGLAIRVRDGVADRDRTPAVTPRDPSPDDTPLFAALVSALPPDLVPLVRTDDRLPARPVALDEAQGLHLRLAAAAVPRAHEVLQRLVDTPGPAPWIDWSLPRSGELHVMVWHPRPLAERRWR
jgi:hypothetical protein